MSKHAYTNRLIRETSPYLLQHAHNPVDWFPWGEEAFEKARKENKPILISIGYSTCHWCHVMERESFENEEVAEFMNEHFVNIKLDREERPDIDQIYMEAIQVLTGSGGWPLNCFLTPELKPFYGGTYFPPQPAYGRASWMQILQGLSEAFHRKKDEVEEQAERLTKHIRESGGHLMSGIDWVGKAENVFNPVMIDNIFFTMEKRFDKENGGFGTAPKFPGVMSLEFLLDYHYYSKRKAALEHVVFSLEKMIRGGIYDQLGGGFARYATDAAWLVPHFEKMLYDNALLMGLLSEAYSATGNELFLKTIKETFEWIEREMLHEEGGFYSALDADSEGIEGKFYVWDKTEIDELLGTDAAVFCEYYDVSPQGNWEGHNILNRKKTISELTETFGRPAEEINEIIKKAKSKLLSTRAKRIRPALDDKMLLDWNALMSSALCKAYKATGIPAFKDAAVKNLGFIYKFFKNGDGFYHSYREGQSKHEAFLDDYAFLIENLLELYSITYQNCYLQEARRLSELAIKEFYDEDSYCFRFTRQEQQDVLVHKKEVFDNATPSGNSTMAMNLSKLGVLIGEEKYNRISDNMLYNMKDAAGKYPTSFSKWCRVLLYRTFPTHEIAIVGKEYLPLAEMINKLYLPNKVTMASLDQQNAYPLLENRGMGNETLIYLCTNFTCQEPVSSFEGFLTLLGND